MSENSFDKNSFNKKKYKNIRKKNIQKIKKKKKSIKEKRVTGLEPETNRSKTHDLDIEIIGTQIEKKLPL